MTNYYDSINEAIESLNSAILRQYKLANSNKSSFKVFDSWLKAILDLYMHVDFKND